jgi:hypothetical protein
MFTNLNEKLKLNVIRNMTDAQRHDYLEFLYNWLIGVHMGHTDESPLLMWTKISQMFPPNISKNIVPLYRLATLPKKYADFNEINVRPAPGPIGSWSIKLIGLESVMGVTVDKAFGDDTARIGYKSEIPSELILATPSSIKNAFLTMSHDYMERYPEIERTYQNNNRKVVSYDTNPNWPGSKYSSFDLSEVEYMQDVISKRGGFLRQYECIVKTPPKILMQKVKVFRIGRQVLHPGNDSPHDV